MSKKNLPKKTREGSPLHLHFIGIGGIGMSGIAEVFHNQGYAVSGSDLSSNETTRRLSDLGIRVDHGHAASHVRGASVVVYSSAVKSDNPELIEAKKLQIPCIPRAEALGELMRAKIGIAIAGTHGKTTTTTLMATLLAHADMDPTLIIGGKVDAFGGSARLGQGDTIVVEADESDGSFLYLPAVYAVITNIDTDHLDHYGSAEKIDEAFCAFVARIPFYGKVWVCGDDPGVQRNLPHFSKPYRTYGLGEKNHLRAKNIKTGKKGLEFEVVDSEEGSLGITSLQSFGDHNVRNALGTIGIALTLGIPFERIVQGLAAFKGVRRRFELRYEDTQKRIRILDDYGHHPTEITATLSAARAYLDHSGLSGRILVVFQPHRYTRTLNSANEFASCFGQADSLLLTEIYPAGEAPIPGVNSDFLLEKVRASSSSPKTCGVVSGLEAAADRIVSEVREGDLILCMGAGSITQLPDLIVSRLNA